MGLKGWWSLQGRTFQGNGGRCPSGAEKAGDQCGQEASAKRSRGEPGSGFVPLFLLSVDAAVRLLNIYCLNCIKEQSRFLRDLPQFCTTGKKGSSSTPSGL